MENSAFVPAEAFPPGEYIKDELAARGWSQADLAEIMGRSTKLVSDVIAGKSSVTPETARGLADAFGTSAQLWMNLDSTYRLWRLRPNERVSRRARLYAKGPIKEMARRGFIEPTNDLDALESRVMHFFELASLDDAPAFRYAARKTEYADETTAVQFAWLFRAKALARGVSVGQVFTEDSHNKALSELRPLMAHPADVRKVSSVLASAGIRLVVVEPLAGLKIDGVTFWLDDSAPVIALSMRYGRVDWFWFTLLHELDHVGHREGAVDERLVGKDAERTQGKPAEEQRADSFAAEFEIPRQKLESFVARVAPLFSRNRIEGFAATLGVHPGIVVGRLQHDGHIGWSHSRDLLTDVRDLVVESAVTDGWGGAVPHLGS